MCFINCRERERERERESARACVCVCVCFLFFLKFELLYVCVTEDILPFPVLSHKTKPLHNNSFYVCCIIQDSNPQAKRDCCIAVLCKVVGHLYVLRHCRIIY
jgi:hypothetical protein